MKCFLLSLITMASLINFFGCSSTQELTLNSGITDEFLLSIKPDNSVSANTGVTCSAIEPLVAHVGAYQIYYNVYFATAYRSDAGNYLRTKFPNQDSTSYNISLDLKRFEISDTSFEKAGNPLLFEKYQSRVDAEVKIVSHVKITHGDTVIGEKDVYSSYQASSSVGLPPDGLQDIIIHYVPIAVRQNLIMVDKYISSLNL